jgi:hypothetical protein
MYRPLLLARLDSSEPRGVGLTSYSDGSYHGRPVFTNPLHLDVKTGCSDK